MNRLPRPLGRRSQFLQLAMVAHVFLLSMTISARAFADTPQQIAEDRFRAGLKFYDQQNYEAARVEFLQAHSIYPRPALLRNLALCELKTNRPLDALKHLRAYLEDPNAEARDLAITNMEHAFMRTGHVLVQATGGATLRIDGKDYGNAPFSGPVDVVAGKHFVEVRLNGRTRSRDVDAIAGTTVDVDLRFPSMTSAAAPGGGTSAPLERLAPPQQSGESSWWNTRSKVGVGVASVGLVLGGAATYFFIDSANERARGREYSDRITSKSGCASGADPNCKAMQDAFDAQDRSAILGTVFAIAGGAGVVTGMILMWPSDRSSRVSLKPSVSPSFAGLRLQGQLP